MSWSKVSQFQMPSGTPANGQVISYPDEGFQVGITRRLTGISLDPSSQSTIINALQFGGNMQTKIGTFNGVNGANPIAISGLGFKPDCVIIWSIGQFVNNDVPLYWTFGVATDPNPAQQWCTTLYRGFIDDGNNRSQFWDGRVIAKPTPVGAPTQSYATLSSFDTDGFTLAYVGSEPTYGPSSGLIRFTNQYVYLALKGGGRLQAGVSVQPTANGRTSVGFGWRPRTALFSSAALAASQVMTGGANFNIGAASASPAYVNPPTTDQACSACLMQPVGGNSQRGWWSMEKDCVMRFRNWNGTDWTPLGGRASCSFHSSGFHLDWTESDGIARKFGYLGIEGGDSYVKQQAHTWLFWNPGNGANAFGLGGPGQNEGNPIHAAAGGQMIGVQKTLAGPQHLVAGCAMDMHVLTAPYHGYDSASAFGFLNYGTNFAWCGKIVQTTPILGPVAPTVSMYLAMTEDESESSGVPPAPGTRAVALSRIKFTPE